MMRAKKNFFNEASKIYKESEANLDLIKSKTVGVIGFGNQGRAQALNLKDSGIDLLELNEVHEIDYYIDGADEFNDRNELIKGGGGALTREKILANSSKKFICIVDF